MGAEFLDQYLAVRESQPKVKGAHHQYPDRFPQVFVSYAYRCHDFPPFLNPYYRRLAGFINTLSFYGPYSVSLLCP